MKISRRSMLSAPLFVARSGGLKLGVMDGVLRASSRPESVGLAKGFGLEGLQVTIGRPDAAGRLPLESPELQSQFRTEAKRHGVVLDATYLDVLHVNCLKNDALAREWIRRGIDITRALGAPILMTVFFGQCAVQGRTELETVAGAFKELAPAAEKAGIILGFENLLTAEDNARAMDIVASKAFKIYYDVGNSTNMVGVDAAKEIRWLGRDRICQFHFKDKGYLGEGKVEFRPILDAISGIGFEGFANFETGAPSGDRDADLRRNVEYVRRLMA